MEVTKLPCQYKAATLLMYCDSAKVLRRLKFCGLMSVYYRIQSISFASPFSIGHNGANCAIFFHAWTVCETSKNNECLLAIGEIIDGSGKHA